MVEAICIHLENVDLLMKRSWDVLQSSLIWQQVPAETKAVKTLWLLKFEILRCTCSDTVPCWSRLYSALRTEGRALSSRIHAFGWKNPSSIGTATRGGSEEDWIRWGWGRIRLPVRHLQLRTGRFESDIMWSTLSTNVDVHSVPLQRSSFIPAVTGTRKFNFVCDELFHTAGFFIVPALQLDFKTLSLFRRFLHPLTWFSSWLQLQSLHSDCIINRRSPCIRGVPGLQSILAALGFEGPSKVGTFDVARDHKLLIHQME